MFSAIICLALLPPKFLRVFGSRSCQVKTSRISNFNYIFFHKFFTPLVTQGNSRPGKMSGGVCQVVRSPGRPKLSPPTFSGVTGLYPTEVFWWQERAGYMLFQRTVCNLWIITFELNWSNVPHWDFAFYIFSPRIHPPNGSCIFGFMGLYPPLPDGERGDILCPKRSSHGFGSVSHRFHENHQAAIYVAIHNPIPPSSFSSFLFFFCNIIIVEYFRCHRISSIKCTKIFHHVLFRLLFIFISSFPLSSSPYSPLVIIVIIKIFLHFALFDLFHF